MHDTWKSKKLWFSVFCIASAFGFAVLAATVMPNLGKFFDGFTSVLEFAAGAYLSGNVVNKFVATKAPPAAEVTVPPAAPKAKSVPPGGPRIPE